MDTAMAMQCSDLVYEEVQGVISAPLHLVWPIVSDFCGLHKWVPSVQSCATILHNELPVRVPVTYPTKNGLILWAKERLIEMDPANYSLSYVVEESNMGLEDYQASMKLSPLGSNTLIRWSFRMSAASPRSKEEQAGMLKWAIGHLQTAANSCPHFISRL